MKFRMSEVQFIPRMVTVIGVITYSSRFNSFYGATFIGGGFVTSTMLGIVGEILVFLKK